MSHIVKKRVTMWELFYDLIFVFAISKLVQMIHHLHHGVVNWVDYGLFAAVVIMVMQAWMYQTTFMNKYGEERWSDLIGLWGSMLGAIYVAVSINTTWETTFYPFNIGMLLMQGALLFQFWFARRDYEKSSHEYKEINAFLSLIGFGSLVVLVGLFLGYQIGVWLMVFAYFFQAYSPWFFKEQFLGHTMNFPHLVERTGLITIILFGESIVGLTSVVTKAPSQLTAILIFFNLIFMFAAYQMQTEEVMDHAYHTNGMFLMHLHLLLPIGLLTVTAGWEYLLEEVNTIFLVVFLLLGTAIFYLTLFATSRYNKAKFPFTKGDLIHYLGVYVLGGVLAFLVKDNQIALPAVFAVINLGMMAKNASRLLKERKEETA